MDLSSFVDDNWEIKKWLNSAFLDVSKDKRDSHAAALLTKLQLVSQDIAASIEDFADKGSLAVPRAARELEATKQDAWFLKRHMEAAKTKLDYVEKKTNNSIRVLLSIDRTKEVVENSEKALKKVDNWSQLVREAENSFQDRDMSSITDKIAQLDSSILIFQGAPDYNEKKTLLEEFKNKVEALLSSSIILAVNSRNTEAAKTLFQHLKKIGRPDHFKSYYVKSTRNTFKNLWEQTNELERIFLIYQELENKLEDHLSFIDAVFGREECGNIILELYCYILNDLPIKEDIKYLTDESDLEGSFHILSNIKLTSKNFIDTLKRHQKGKTMNEQNIQKIVQAVWKPFSELINNYGNLMEQYLIFKTLELSLEGNLMTVSERIFQARGALKEIHNKVFQQTVIVTDDFGLGMALLSLKNIHFKIAERTISAIEKAKDQDSNNEGWTLFSCGLSILDTIGPLFQDFDELSNEFLSKFANLERFSTCKMMHETSNSNWEFNILQYASPVKFTELQNLIDDSLQNQSRHLFEESIQEFAKIAQFTVDLSFSSFFDSIENSMKSLCKQSVWSRNEAPLPPCGYSPSEMITRVGDSLLTLPQHLDPLSNESMKNSLLNTKLKYIDDVNLDDLDSEEKYEREHGAPAWLCAAGNGACQVFIQNIMEIEELSEWGRFQMLCDLGYLESVSESLGVEITKDWSDLRALLSVNIQDLPVTASAAPKMLADKICKMRNLVT